MKYYFKVAQTVVEISFEKEIVKEYLEKDFGLLACQPCEPSVILEVKNNTDMLPPDIKNDNGFEFRTTGGYIYQYFSAFQRHFWVRYKFCDDRIEIVLFIPYDEKGTFKQFMSPYFEKPLQSCLTDYFHNTFLAVLQYTFMSYESSLFHCSAFQTKTTEKTVVLSGGAQCGKSSLMTALSKKEALKICAEDYAVVTAEQVLYGYLHQTRVKFADMKDAKLNYYPYKDGIILGILNRCNKKVYSILTKGKNGRHFSMKDFFKDDFICKAVPLKKDIFILARGGDEPNIIQLDLDTFCKVQVEIIMSEFINMKGSTKLFQYLSAKDGEEWNEKGFQNRIYCIYKNAFKNLQCYYVVIPYYPHLESAAKELEKIILTSNNQ